MRIILAVAACLSLGVPAVAADGGLYLVATNGTEGWFLDSTTIAAGSANHKTATVYVMRAGIQGNFDKYEFDCKARTSRMISGHHYEFDAGGTILTSIDLTPDAKAVSAPAGTLVGDTAKFVCDAPKSLAKESVIPKASDDVPTLVLWLARAADRTFKK
jgi:hypothetical protein